MATTEPPGWYPDPWRVGAWRWWDGWQWTSYVGGDPSAEQAARARLQTTWNLERRMLPWARAALCVFGLTLIANAILFLTTSGQLHHEYQQILHPFRYDQNLNVPASSLGGRVLVQDLVELVAAAVSVVFFIWQYNAASTARALGYRARVSPGLGVGSWFIPVVNLWFPYRALADCLPQHHPLRARALGAWLSYCLAGAVSGASAVVAVFSSSGVPVLLSSISMALIVLAVGLGLTLMTATAADHYRALQSLP